MTRMPTAHATSGSSHTSNLFSRATGLSWWNDMMKQISSVMTQNRIMKNALVGDYSKLGEHDRALMGYLNISEDMAQRFAQQFEKHGLKERGIYGANVSKWDDEFAARAYAAALAKDVDRTIVTKGVSDTPLWMKTNTGKMIMQFKGFGMASHQRCLSLAYRNAHIGLPSSRCLHSHRHDGGLPEAARKGPTR